MDELRGRGAADEGQGGHRACRASLLALRRGDRARSSSTTRKHPVAIANGDLQYIDLIAKYCKSLDILGSNVYRGPSARDFFQVVNDKLGVPAMFTEFGADAYDAKQDREDATAQAEYLRAQWQEIYEQSWGKGGVGNAIGGFIFQWTDGWWKHGQENNLDVHDTTASWPNAAYARDFVAGENNMNEEWFGIAAIDDQDADGFYQVQPRVAYYVLRAAFRLDPYAETTTTEEVRAHFGALHADELAANYESLHASAERRAAVTRARVGPAHAARVQRHRSKPAERPRERSALRSHRVAVHRRQRAADAQDPRQGDGQPRRQRGDRTGSIRCTGRTARRASPTR